MSKLLVFNDPHIADNPPAGRKDDYMESLLAKLDEIVALANNQQVDVLVCTGDLFHVKNPKHVSHHLVSRIIEVLDTLNMDFYIVPGNHDLTSAGLSSLEKQPLYSLEAAGCLRILLKPILLYDDITLLPVPWNHEREVDPEYYAVPNELKNCPRLVMVAHGPLLAPGDVRPYPFLNVDEIPGIDACRIVFSGHIHERLGLTELDNGAGTQFCNFGSVSRLARTQANMLRQVSVALYDSESNNITELALKEVKSIAEVFRTEESKDAPALDQDSIAKLADLVGKGVKAETLTIEELVAGACGDNVSAQAQRIVVELLQEAETSG